MVCYNSHTKYSDQQEQGDEKCLHDVFFLFKANKIAIIYQLLTIDQLP